MKEKLNEFKEKAEGWLHVLSQKIAELEKDSPFHWKKENLKIFFRNADHVVRSAMLVMALFIAYIFGSYAVRPLVSAEARQEREYIIRMNMGLTTIFGSIVDRNGLLIRGGAERGYIPYVDDEHNWQLLGYYNLDERGQLSGDGILGKCGDELDYIIDHEGKGATVQLTVDEQLQQEMTQLLYKEPFAGNREGACILVMDNSTGELIAYASRAGVDFDVNNPSAVFEAGIPAAGFIRGVYEWDPPGSTFKILTALAAYRYAKETGQDMSIFDYNDDGSTVNGIAVDNAGGESWGECDLHKGFVCSINTVMANAGFIVGAQRLKDTAEDFLIGTAISIPKFASFSSKFKLSSRDKYSLAHTSYGQGYTEVTPMNLLLIVNAIANGGDMMQPHIVKSISSGDSILYEEEIRTLANPITEDESAYLKELMHDAALGYYLAEDLGMVYAKTGTAQCEEDESGKTSRGHTYMVGFTEQYSFVISNNDGDSSYALYDPYTESPASEVIRAVNNYYSRGE